jgi:hypothetical protein
MSYQLCALQPSVASTNTCNSTTCPPRAPSYGCDANGAVIPYPAGVGACTSPTACNCYVCNPNGTCSIAPANVSQTTPGLYSSLATCNSACLVTYGCNGTGGITTYPGTTGACGTNSSPLTCKCFWCSSGSCGFAPANVNQATTGLYTSLMDCQSDTVSCFQTATLGATSSFTVSKNATSQFIDLSTFSTLRGVTKVDIAAFTYTFQVYYTRSATVNAYLGFRIGTGQTYVVTQTLSTKTGTMGTNVSYSVPIAAITGFGVSWGMNTLITVFIQIGVSTDYTLKSATHSSLSLKLR